MSAWLVFNKSEKKFIILNSKTLAIMSQGFFFFFSAGAVWCPTISINLQNAVNEQMWLWIQNREVTEKLEAG